MSSSASAASAWTAAHPADPITRTAVVNAIYCALCGLSLFPFLWFDQPPITDFANHAARLTIACAPREPAIAAMYHYGFGIIPNLAVDAVNLPLCGLVEPSMVLRLVTAGSLAVIYFSAWLTQRSLFGRPNAFLFLAPAIAFNIVTLMGYINYLAGIAVALLMVALAVGRKRSFRWLVVACNLGGIALFFSHIFALAFGLMVFFGIQLGKQPRSLASWSRAAFRTLVLFAAPLILMAFVPAGHQPLQIGYGDKLRAFPPVIMADGFSMRLLGLAVLGALYLAVRANLVRIHPALRAPLAIGGLFVLLAPNQLQQAYDVDVRTLVALAYLGFAALEPVRRGREAGAILVTASACLIATQLWATVTIWQPFSGQVDEFRAAATALPATARVLPVSDPRGDQLIAWPTAYVHLTSYATIDRKIFNPLEFTGVGMQPLWPTGTYAAIDPEVGPALSSEDANKLAEPTARTERVARSSPLYRFAVRWPRTFDYVVYYHFGRPRNFDSRDLTEVRSGSFFTISKVDHPTTGAPR